MKKDTKTSAKQKKYALLNEGILAFMTRGYHGVGLKQLLNTCGIPKGSFYHYFDSKDDFLAQVIEYYTDMLFVMYDNIASQEISAFEKIQRITQMKQQMRRMSNVKGCLWGAMVAETIENVAPAQEVMMKVYERWMTYFIELFAEAQLDKDITNTLHPEALANLYWNQWQGGLLQSQLQTDSTAQEKQFKLFFQLISTN